MKRYIERIAADKRLMEYIRYITFGVATTVVNIVTYQLLLLFLDYKVSNLLAIIVSKVFAYVTNKLFVFCSRCNSKKELFLEIVRFFMARGATGLLDYFGLLIAVEIMQLNKIHSKYIIQIIVIILNYVLGKHAVFRNVQGKEN